jgi:hypothetical protein
MNIITATSLLCSLPTSSKSLQKQAKPTSGLFSPHTGHLQPESFFFFFLKRAKANPRQQQQVDLTRAGLQG